MLWHIRERFRADLVRGSDAAAINESHQLYIDGLKLSPPSPTMLDLRDAMLEADAIRNPGSPDSLNFCALWESFAARGMGVDATDTADNGLNQVGANFAVPTGCTAQPSPPLVTLAVAAATATEAGPTSGMVTISREAATEAALAVNLTVTGTATRAIDYVALPASAIIPAGAVSVDVPVVPLDDATLEGNETVVVTLRSGPGYILAPPTVGTVTIVSDDVAPDFTVTVLTGPALGGAGLTLDVTDTTRNQGTGPSGESTTSFYLSLTTALDATDPLVGTRSVPGLLPGTTDIATTTLMVPAGTAAGTYWIIAKADGPGAVGEPNETNNTRTLLVRVGPDLAVTALTAPPVAGPGASVIVNDTTKNQGGGHAAASATRFYLSPNSTLDASDAALESHGVEPLTVGASATTTTTVRIPTTVTSGTFYLIAVADDGNALSESTENNNTRFVTIRIGADLMVSALTAPTRVGSGSTISVTDTIRNSGGGGSGPSTTAFYLSANQTFDAGDARLSGTRSVGPLDAGASSLGTTAVTLPAVTTGTWYSHRRLRTTPATSPRPRRPTISASRRSPSDLTSWRRA